MNANETIESRSPVSQGAKTFKLAMASHDNFAQMLTVCSVHFYLLDFV